MIVKIFQIVDVQCFFEEVSGQFNECGDLCIKVLVWCIFDDMVKLIEEMQVMFDEFWKVVDYLNCLGSCQEVGLLVVGLGLEYYLDLLFDVQDVEVGFIGGMLCIIEGLLYVVGVLLSDGEVWMDDGCDVGIVMFFQGCVSGFDGQLLVGVIVDVWYVNI